MQIERSCCQLSGPAKSLPGDVAALDCDHYAMWHGNSLRACNEKTPMCMRALQRTPITFKSREIHSATFRQSAMNHTADSAMMPVCSKQKMEK
jgi:hypothetical protein